MGVTREHVLYLRSDSVINLWRCWKKGSDQDLGVPVCPRWLRLPADTGSTQSITKATRKATCTGQADLLHTFILGEGEGQRGEKKRKRLVRPNPLVEKQREEAKRQKSTVTNNIAFQTKKRRAGKGQRRT